METKSKFFELEERMIKFASSIIMFSNGLPKTTANRIISSQVIRSAGSVGANYIEANESLSKKDFIMRVKISRKEARETAYWLRLISETTPQTKSNVLPLLKECSELVQILSSILKKVQ